MAEEGKQRKIPKWGFGMAPLKPETDSRYRAAVHTISDFLIGNLGLEQLLPESVSEVKGLVNRCIRQDQWDWFTVYFRFGEPDPKDFHRIAQLLTQLRIAINESDNKSIARLRQELINRYFLTFCYHFLGNKVSLSDLQLEGGYIYILSTREQPQILKIGMTTRSVFERVKEINAATGVLIPFSARRIFKVKDARKAEKELFSVLDTYRIRSDREFFEIDFGKAVRIIEQYLDAERLLSRFTGTVKWFSIEKCYGFITTASGEEVFVHISEVKASDIDQLKSGSKVEFNLGYRPEGRCARDVCVA